MAVRVKMKRTMGYTEFSLRGNVTQFMQFVSLPPPLVFSSYLAVPLKLSKCQSSLSLWHGLTNWNAEQA